MEKITKSDSEWREQLTPEQYAVLRQHATERPFTGEYVKTKTRESASYWEQLTRLSKQQGALLDYEVNPS